MNKNKKSSIEVQGTAITIMTQNEHDYISTLDIFSG